MLQRSPGSCSGAFLKGCLALVAGSWLGGCAARVPETTAQTATPSSSAAPLSCEPQRDRDAILAMAGSYHVTFDFEETDVLTKGYEKYKPLHTGATELVLVLENTPGRVSLQHLLVISDDVTKHWRQDWTFEDRELLEFQGKNQWTKRSISAERARCSWTQAVFEVDDSPRYEGVGRWVHAADSSVWQSNQTFRPLPRREYKMRHDYDVLVGVNRHRITPNGWSHEQDNEKLVLEPRHSLVRERGLNRYTRIDASQTQAAAGYWQATSVFWQQVRNEWSHVLESRDPLQLTTEIDGERLYEPLFARAEDKAARNTPEATRAFIHDSIGRYVVGTVRP